jgi:hypothetical protein
MDALVATPQNVLDHGRAALRDISLGSDALLRHALLLTDPWMPYSTSVLPLLLIMPIRRTDPVLHRIYMSFVFREGWYCQFLEADLKTILPKKLTFAVAEKVRELAQHGGAFKHLASKHAVDQGIDNRQGGVWLNLTAAQYARFKRE